MFLTVSVCHNRTNPAWYLLGRLFTEIDLVDMMMPSTATRFRRNFETSRSVHPSNHCRDVDPESAEVLRDRSDTILPRSNINASDMSLASVRANMPSLSPIAPGMELMHGTTGH